MMNSVSLRAARRWGVLFGGLLLLWSSAAFCQVGGLYWQCVPPDATHTQGSFCPASTLYSVPVAQTYGGVVTPVVLSDVFVYSPPFKALYNGNGSACNINVVMAGDPSNTPVLLHSVPTGVILGTSVKMVLNVLTTCSQLDGIY